MGEMVERVAGAIYEAYNDANYDGGLGPFSDLTAGQRAEYEAAARVAIAAMREPTERMVVAGSMRVGAFHGTGAARALARERHQAMIDEALK